METISDLALCSNFRQGFLREIENALLANHKRLYHLGMEAVAKSTLSEAMNRRNPEIFKALFEELLDRVMAVFLQNSMLKHQDSVSRDTSTGY